MPLADAVIDAGAVRFRPMLLTAGAVIVGAGVILFDPIFQGLGDRADGGRSGIAVCVARDGTAVVLHGEQKTSRQDSKRYCYE